MLVAGIELEYRMVVDYFVLHLEWLRFVILLSVQQHVPISHAPTIQVLFIPRISEVLPSSNTVNWFREWYSDY